MKTQYLFFIGKGGVGKSTCSALKSVQLSEAARKTLLVSMDPAHNQRDIFEADFSERPQKMRPFLWVKEVDVEYWMKKYLKETQNHLKKIYTYQGAFNLDGYFKILRFSPGLEEYAMSLAFESVIHEHDDMDAIVFDMPPTALTLRFFSLPAITLVWVAELLKLRRRIYAKKEIISKIKMGKLEIEQDHVQKKLETLKRSFQHLKDHFVSKQTRIHLVLNIDKLSVSEALRIQDRLTGIGIRIDRVVVNKVRGEDRFEPILSSFGEQALYSVPLAADGFFGMEKIIAHLRDNPDMFSDFRHGLRRYSSH
jgi:arsenite-transporting ATPase